MATLNVLFANIYNLKDKISGRLWKCCEEHSLNIEFAANMHELLESVGKKRYHGLILGNSPSNASHTGMEILRKVRILKGYEHIPAVILIKHPNELVYDMTNELNRHLLIVPENELVEQKMIMKIIHEHFMQLNQ